MNPERKTTAWDVVIIGAGAAGLMCAFEAAKRGRSVLVLDHAVKPCEKIRISGGGRCNFTNLDAGPQHFISQNPHFCKSALKRFTPHDFLARVQARGIATTEKAPGQMFCLNSATDIIDMLISDARDASAELRFGSQISTVTQSQDGFEISCDSDVIQGHHLVIATGGLSIPKIGATGFGYEIAQQFDHKIVTTHPGLVPLVLHPDDFPFYDGLAGVSFPANLKILKTTMSGPCLITHKGFSGPCALQISSYWQPGQPLEIDYIGVPGFDLNRYLSAKRQEHPRQSIHTALGEFLPRRLVERFLSGLNYPDNFVCSDLSNATISTLNQSLRSHELIPAGTEGYRTAEVTVGGVDTDDISSQTLESKRVAGLYFIGECLDVTGHLGGYNFQWAWSSGWAAGQVV